MSVNSSYALQHVLSANGKESLKMIQDPRKNPDPLQKLIDILRHSFLNISSKFVQNLLIFSRQTDRQTDHYDNTISLAEAINQSIYFGNSQCTSSCLLTNQQQTRQNTILVIGDLQHYPFQEPGTRLQLPGYPDPVSSSK